MRTLLYRLAISLLAFDFSLWRLLRLTWAVSAVGPSSYKAGRGSSVSGSERTTYTCRILALARATFPRRTHPGIPVSSTL
jgi:hypothetical protein